MGDKRPGPSPEPGRKSFRDGTDLSVGPAAAAYFHDQVYGNTQPFAYLTTFKLLL
jgi:hypothetical protein